MNRRPRRKLDLRWTPANRLALTVVCVVSAALLAARAVWRPRWAGPGEAPVDERRVRAAAEKINPNTATAASLRRLPGIGAVRARAILEYRRRHGPGAFRCAEDLQAVPGIGPATVRGIAPFLALPRRRPATTRAARAAAGPTSRRAPDR
jgi:competence ComEA-like helix-hairpin-helix protein